MKYKYFVSFICAKDGKTGFGNTIVKRNKPLASDEAITGLEKQMAEEQGCNRVILLNFKEV